jgi:hypothetical protein
MASTRSSEESLHRLAEAAWGTRRIIPNPAFVLRSADLPQPYSADAMTAVVERLYGHARKWAPGFEVPYGIPKVSVSSRISAAGQYRADRDGYLFIDVAQEFVGRPEAVLAILAHEACHHILDLSGFRARSGEDIERLTDLSSFICGFGELVLSGHSHVRKIGSEWASVHLGYLSVDEYRSAQQWVLHVQGLDGAEPTHRQRTGGTGVFGWLTRLFRSRNRESAQASSIGPSLAFDSIVPRRKVALTRLGGDRARLDRLIEYERSRNPTADELALLDAVIETLEKDRR